MPTELKTYQTQHPWGKPAFSSLSMSCSPDPQVAEFCSSLSVEGANMTIVSVQRGTPLFTYTHDPVLLMSLDDSTCFVNYQHTGGLLGILAETGRPIQAALSRMDAAAYEELLYWLSALYDTDERAAGPMVRRKNEALARLVETAVARAGELDAEGLLREYKRLASERPLFFFETRVVELLGRATACADAGPRARLLAEAALHPFLERFGHMRGQATALVRGAPLVLGAGEYAVFEARCGGFVGYLDSVLAAPEQFGFDPAAAAALLDGARAGAPGIRAAAVGARVDVELDGAGRFAVEAIPARGQTVARGPGRPFLLCQLVGALQVDGQKKLVPAYYAVGAAEATESVLTATMADGAIGMLVISRD